MDTKVLEARDLTLRFGQGDTALTLFEDLNLTVHSGEQVAIVGRSGSGKTSLLNLLAGLSMPTAGTVELVGKAYDRRNQAARDRWRAGRLGMVFQFHHLLGEFSALENVALALRLAGHSKADSLRVGRSWLAEVGLAARADHLPATLSGGERQRVAIARALAPKPPVVLMDEPTGNLDYETAEQIQGLLKSLTQNANMALVLVTHDRGLAASTSRQLTLCGGQLVPFDGQPSSP